MKKVFAVCLAAGLFSLVACGPSAEEQAKKEAEMKEQLDSLFDKANNAAKDTGSATQAQPDTSHAGHNH